MQETSTTSAAARFVRQQKASITKWSLIMTKQNRRARQFAHIFLYPHFAHVIALAGSFCCTLSLTFCLRFASPRFATLLRCFAIRGDGSLESGQRCGPHKHTWIMTITKAHWFSIHSLWHFRSRFGYHSLLMLQDTKTTQIAEVKASAIKINQRNHKQLLPM